MILDNNNCYVYKVLVYILMQPPYFLACLFSQVMLCKQIFFVLNKRSTPFNTRRQCVSSCIDTVRLTQPSKKLTTVL